jgi:hypothetical protein
MPGPPSEVKYSNDDFERLKERVRSAGFAEIRIVSDSMAPLLPVGALARIEACDFDRVARYDLVVFWYDGKLMCHCVWDRGVLPAANGERTLVTKGLANSSADDPVRESWILGRVVSHRATPLGFFWNHLKAKWSIKRRESRDRI